MRQSELCVIAQDDIVPQEFTTYFCSVIAFGKVRIASDEKEKLEAINKLAIKYCPDESAEARRREIEREISGSVHSRIYHRASVGQTGDCAL